MTNLIIVFVVLLFLPCRALAQDPFPTPTQAPSPPGQTLTTSAQTGSLTGTVTSINGEVVPYAQVTVRNVTTGTERVVTTNENGLFTVTGLSPGSYDVIIGSSHFAQKTVRNVELKFSETTSLNIELSGNDVPISSETKGGGGRKKPTAIESDPDKVSNDKSPPPENRPDKSVNANSRAPTGSEVSEKRFKTDIELLKWLDKRKGDQKLLVTIIPVGDQTSLFVLDRVEHGISFEYSVFLVNQLLEPDDLSTRIDQNKNKTFIGVHRLSPSSYLMVFYGK